jgi:hypothetical protein
MYTEYGILDTAAHRSANTAYTFIHPCARMLRRHTNAPEETDLDPALPA